MDQMMKEGKTEGYKRECAAQEQARERKMGMDYMRERHGLVEEKKSAYRPVGRGKRKY